MVKYTPFVCWALYLNTSILNLKRFSNQAAFLPDFSIPNLISISVLYALVFLWNMYHSISQKPPSPGYHVINVVINLLLSMYEIEPDNIKIKINIGKKNIFYNIFFLCINCNAFFERFLHKMPELTNKLFFLRLVAIYQVVHLLISMLVPLRRPSY